MVKISLHSTSQVHAKMADVIFFYFKSSVLCSEKTHSHNTVVVVIPIN